MASLMEQAQSIASQNKIDPYAQGFDESKGVAGRVNDITSSGSPLMQRAATRASQAAAARGLTNSTLAAGAGEAAMIDTATPIATADAQLYASQQLKNQDAINSARTNNATNAVGLAGNAMNLGNSNEQQAKQLAESGRQFDVSSSQNAQSMQLQRDQLNQQQSQFEQSQAQNMKLAQMDEGLRRDLAALENSSKEAVQGSQNIANAWGSMMQGITSIQTNPELSNATKTTLIQQQLDQFKAFSTFWGKTSSVDVGDLLNFSTATPIVSTTPADKLKDAQSSGGGPSANSVYAGGNRGGSNNDWNTSNGGD